MSSKPGQVHNAAHAVGCFSWETVRVDEVLPELILADAAGWRAWLGDNHAQEPGVWLVLAKKGATVLGACLHDRFRDRRDRALFPQGEVRSPRRRFSSGGLTALFGLAPERTSNFA